MTNVNVLHVQTKFNNLSSRRRSRAKLFKPLHWNSEALQDIGEKDFKDWYF